MKLARTLLLAVRLCVSVLCKIMRVRFSRAHYLAYLYLMCVYLFVHKRIYCVAYQHRACFIQIAHVLRTRAHTFDGAILKY